MLHVTVPSPQHVPATLEWEVVDLLLSDERFVQEMFEDIVTAEWPPTPEAPVRNPPCARGNTAGVEKPEPPASSVDLPARQHRLHRPGTDGWARERSPPKRPTAQPQPSRSKPQR
jgi:hypothetical protein